MEKGVADFVSVKTKGKPSPAFTSSLSKRTVSFHPRPQARVRWRCHPALLFPSAAQLSAMFPCVVWRVSYALELQLLLQGKLSLV